MFTSAAWGGGCCDVTRDFENGKHTLDLKESGYMQFADLLADTSMKDGRLMIDFDFAGLLRIDTLSLAQFDATDVQY